MSSYCLMRSCETLMWVVEQPLFTCCTMRRFCFSVSVSHFTKKCVRICRPIPSQLPLAVQKASWSYKSLSPCFLQSRIVVHLFRPYLESVWLLFLQNGSRTLRWQGPQSPATLPTSRRPTGTLRQDLQSPMQWGKNVSSHLHQI